MTAHTGSPGDSLAYIEFKRVTKAFGDNLVLRGMDLAIDKGEIMFIIGTSGVG